jgi:hypothetical protein
MPIFFFKFRTGNRSEEDPRGVDLPDLDAAVEEATQAAREIVSDAVRFGRDDAPEEIIITDDADRRLSAVTLADVVPVTLRK